MKILLFIFFQLINGLNNLNIKFLGGSFVKKHIYKPLLNNIQLDLLKNNINCNYQFVNYFDKVNNDPNTILICHSFGSYFGLLKTMKDTTNNIKGCIIINGNFNQRRKMFYPGIKLRKINKNVLVILNKDDERLPLNKAIDDFYVKCEENIKNIYFEINNGSHFSSFKNRNEINIVTKQIIDFIKLCKFENKVFYHDSLFSFIKSKPNNQNQIFYNKNNVYFKTNNLNINEYLENYYTFPIEYNKIYLNITNISDIIDHVIYFPVDWNKVYLNVSNNKNRITCNKKTKSEITCLPCMQNYMQYKYNFLFRFINFLNKKSQIFKILYLWFTKKPKITITKDKKINCDLFIIPVKDNIVYYKFPCKENILNYL